MLSKQQTIAKLNELEKLSKSITECFEKLEGVLGMDYFEGEMYQAVTNLIDSYADTIAECSGISQEALTWWILDAGWGEGTNGVVVDGNITHLTTNEEFVNYELGSE